MRKHSMIICKGGIMHGWVTTEPDVGITENTDTQFNTGRLSATIVSGRLVRPDGINCKICDISGRSIAPTTITRGIYFVEVDSVLIQKVVKVK